MGNITFFGATAALPGGLVGDVGRISINAAGWLGSKFGLAINTPYGYAFQSFSSKALVARALLNQEDILLYRVGVTNISAAAEAQFWSFELPLQVPNYAQKYGLAVQNTQYNFLEVGKLGINAKFITRVASPVGANIGGEIEIVTEENSINLKYWHMR